MRVYEDYGSPQAKRELTRGAVRGRATGKANWYLLVFDEDGLEYLGSDAGPVYTCLSEVVAAPRPEAPEFLVVDYVSVDYLAQCCRRVGFDSIPQGWKEAFARRLEDIYAGGPMPPGYHRLVSRVRRLQCQV